MVIPTSGWPAVLAIVPEGRVWVFASAPPDRLTGCVASCEPLLATTVKLYVPMSLGVGVITSVPLGCSVLVGIGPLLRIENVIGSPLGSVAWSGTSSTWPGMTVSGPIGLSVGGSSGPPSRIFGVRANRSSDGSLTVIG